VESGESDDFTDRTMPTGRAPVVGGGLSVSEAVVQAAL